VWEVLHALTAAIRELYGDDMPEIRVYAYGYFEPTGRNDNP
jgi:hypothetical protein